MPDNPAPVTMQPHCPQGARRWQRLAPGLTQLLMLLALASPPARAQPAATCPPVATAPTPAQIQSGLRDARDRGLLWRLEKDGRVAWLYGTVHLGRPGWAFPGRQLKQALAASDTVALELDLGDPAVATAFADAIDTLRAADARQPLPAALRARLAAAGRAECLQGAAFEQQPPLIQALALSSLAARRDGLDPAYAQEFTLAGFARASGKQVVSLETPAAQLAALVPDDPTALPDTLARVLDKLESGQARRLAVRIAALWASGDLAALDNHAAWCECADSPAEQAELRRLNDARNPALADGITALVAQGKRVFAGVGALHMTGPQALPLLLAQRGFAVQRVPLAPP